MTTREFIKRRYGAPNRYGWCSSVFVDNDGNMYSYGYHYPLLFNVAGIDFINTRGYSVTTAKHINWAKSAANDLGLNPIEVHWPNDGPLGRRIEYLTTDQKLDVILNALLEHATALQKELLRKTRTDTQIYAQLSYEAGKALGYLHRFQEARQEMRGQTTN